MDLELRQALIFGSRSFWIAVFVFVAFNVSGLLFLQTHRSLPFDSTRWKNEEDLRPRMVRGLLKNHDLAGKSRKFVDEMLGVPEVRDSVRNGKYLYWAGSDGVIDDMWLDVHFDNDTVVSVDYVPD